MTVINSCSELIAYFLNSLCFIEYYVGETLEFQGDVCEITGANPKGSKIIATYFNAVFSVRNDYEHISLFIFRSGIIPDEAVCVSLPAYVYNELITTIKNL